METRVIAISDLHATDRPIPECPTRRGEQAEALLQAAVERINSELRPNVVLVLGDLVNDGDARTLKRLRNILAELTCATLVLPGNHDGAPEAFFQVFPPLPHSLDIGGCRLLPFVDPERPGYNACRTEEDIERMRTATRDFAGPVISCQHVPLFTPGSNPCPYNLTNAAEIIRVMQECHVTMSIAGHYHRGFQDGAQPFGTSVAVPALCEEPFPFVDLRIAENGQGTSVTHTLRPL